MKYLWDRGLNLFRRSTPGDFGYSDGIEAEARLLRIVSKAEDRGTFSSELVAAITDWPSEYHLSRHRHCLLRPLGIGAAHRVLELGCGCGAVTRYLGETGAHVVAVDGSLPRARVAAQRCRQLDNVRVVVDDFLHFDTDERFDFVLLIGVLEYAAVYSDRANPYEHYLRSVSRLLAPGGKVVVAIENKLGLKYFNGCGEDHNGVPFFGIQNLYEVGTVRTFGRQELMEQLAAAGLPHTSFYYPFPDYKLPSAIITEEGMRERRFEAVDLLARSHPRDYTGLPYRSFDDALAYSALAGNSLLEDLSNSFLVVASTEASSISNQAELATTFSIHRVPEFCTQTRFVRCDDQISVLKEPLTSAPAHTIGLPDGATVTHQIGASAYQPGRQLLWKLLEARTRGCSLDAMVEALRPWAAFVLQQASPAPGAESATSLASLELPGRFLDCTPFNVLSQGDEWFAIDLEWVSDRAVSLGWVLTRGVAWSVHSGKASSYPIKVSSIIEALCSSLGLTVSESEIQAWLDLEVVFQNALADVPCKPLTVDWTVTGFQTFLDEIAGLKQQVVECRQAAPANQLAPDAERLHSEAANLRAQVHLLHEQLNAAESQLDGVRASNSWRLTAPLRSLRKLKLDRFRARRQKKRDLDLIARSGLFDAEWYVSQYPDVATSAVLPAMHYLLYGGREGRDPSQNFATGWYLAHYSDVAGTGMNPLVHYLRFGAAEGRRPTPPR